MKILSASQVREWDQHTILNEPISSLDLMERAAKACSDWITATFEKSNSIYIFCGTGNNGGDGLAIARQLSPTFSKLFVHIIPSANHSEDFTSNLARLQNSKINYQNIGTASDLPIISSSSIIVDAIFGTGLNKAPQNFYVEVINHINNSRASIISIDMPSGLFADSHSDHDAIVKADYTLTFESPKLSCLIDENTSYTGRLISLQIGLSKRFLENLETQYELIDHNFISKIYKPRKQNTHKGDYGHACLFVGSIGMMGAAVLAAKACMHTGAGKLTTVIPQVGLEIMQIAVPEAMVIPSGIERLGHKLPQIEYDAIGVGPGIGLDEENGELLFELFSEYPKPVVADADALNILSSISKPLKKLPAGSILTPHGREFERLFGKSANQLDRISVALENAHTLGCYIVLKGHHTFIATPSGKGYFNSTGNAGMATGGSGDVLAGMITSLLAQGYPPLEAAMLGVYIHGKAGDLAAAELSQESLVASDIIDYIGKAFLSLNKRGASIEEDQAPTNR